MAKVERKHMYVEFDVQRFLSQRIAMHWISFFVLAVVFSLFFEVNSNSPEQTFTSRMGNVFGHHGVVLFSLLVLIPAFVYDAIKLSNRFAGPMVRFRRALRQLAEGRTVEPIKFRNGDFWTDLPDGFNQVLLRLAKAEADCKKHSTDYTVA